MAPRKTTKSVAKTSGSANPTAKAAKSSKASSSGTAASNTVQSGRVTRSMTSNNVATPNQAPKVKQTPKARKSTKVSQAAKTAQSAKGNSAVKGVKSGKAAGTSKTIKSANDTKSGSSAKTPKTATSATASRFNNLFTMEHDAYVVKLKDSNSGTWKDIAGLFNERYPPANGHDERTSGGLQVRYSRNIKANIKKDKDYYKDALANLDGDSNSASTGNDPAATGQQSSANASQVASNKKSSSSKQPARKKAKTSKGTANVTAEDQEIVEDDDDDDAKPASAGQKKDVQKISEKRKGKMPASVVPQQPDPDAQQNVRRSGRARKPVFRDGSELAAPKKAAGKKRKIDETVSDDTANAAAANVASAAASKKAKSLKRNRDDTVEDEDVAVSQRALKAEMKKTRGRKRNFGETVDDDAGDESNTAPTSSRLLGVKTSFPSGTNAQRQIMPSYKQRRVANAENAGPTVQDFAGLDDFRKDTPITDPRTGERVTTKRRRLHDGPSDVAASTAAPSNESGPEWYELRPITSADNPNLQPTIPAAKPIQRLKSGNWPRAPPLRANANFLQDLADYDESKPNCGLK